MNSKLRIPLCWKAIVARLDLDQVISRIDMNAIIGHVDMNAIIDRLDVVGLAEDVINGVDLPEIIRGSTGSMASEVVRGARMQSVDADEAISRFFDRLIRRRSRHTALSEKQTARLRQAEQAALKRTAASASAAPALPAALPASPDGAAPKVFPAADQPSVQRRDQPTGAGDEPDRES